MSDPTPYLLLPGTARAALTRCAEVFGGSTVLHTYADFGRDDGPADAIAHGMVSGGAVRIFAADAGAEDRPFSSDGLMFALLGTADPETSKAWFAALADGGVVEDDLQEREWGAWDGRVTDRHGVSWLIGFEVSD